jgi:DNA polymerase III sliding clamp (beta) subunit (PCNA family)
MKKLFSVNQDKLLGSLSLIKRTIQDKPIIPAYGFVRIQSTDPESIEITATSPENTTTVTLSGVDVKDDFIIIIDASFVRPLIKRDVLTTFSTDGTICIIECTGSRWEVPTLDPVDYPMVDKEWKPLTQLNIIELQSSLRKSVMFTGEPQFAIGNIHIVSTKDYLSVGATNNNVCHVYQFDKPLEKEFKMLLSRESCSLIKDICDTEEELINVFFHKENYKFVTEDIAIESVSPAFEAQNINDYTALVSKFTEMDHDTIEIIDKDYFKEQINKATAFSAINSSVIIIEIQKNKLHFEVEDSAYGRKSVQEIECNIEQEGDASLMALNYSYLLKAINCIEKESMTIEIPTSNGEGYKCITQPIVIRDNNSTFLLSPMLV